MTTYTKEVKKRQKYIIVILSVLILLTASLVFIILQNNEKLSVKTELETNNDDELELKSFEEMKQSIQEEQYSSQESVEETLKGISDPTEHCKQMQNEVLKKECIQNFQEEEQVVEELNMEDIQRQIDENTFRFATLTKSTEMCFDIVNIALQEKCIRLIST